MIQLVKDLVFPILKVEDKQPSPLPSRSPYEFVRIIRACPAYLQYRLFFWKLYLGVMIAAVLIASIFLAAMGPWYLLVSIPIILLVGYKVAFLYVVTRLDYDVRWYVITDRSVLIRQGVWIVREICLTFANAQNVYVKQGPLQRYFGFSNIELDTAGGGGKSEEQGIQMHRAVLKGLADADELKTLILEQVKRHRATGLGDPGDKNPNSPGFSHAEATLLEDIRVEAHKLRVILEQADAR